MGSKDNNNSNKSNNKEWYDSIIWIFFISYIILIFSESIGLTVTDKIDKSNPYMFTLISYLRYFDTWVGVFLVLYFFRNNNFIISKITTRTKGNNIANLFWGFLVGFLLNAFCVIIAIINGDFTLKFFKFELLKVLGLFFAVFVQSSAEELICRGFMYQRLLKSTNNADFSIILNSLFFAYLHLDNDGMTFLPLYCIFIVGVFFSMLVFYFDSIWMAMGAHAMWNFTQSILLGLPNSGIKFPYSVFKMGETIKGSFAYNKVFGLEGTVLSCVLMTICCVLLYIWKSKKNKEEIVLN